MQTKLTLSIDESVIEQAKQYAKEQGVSLSKLVQEFLKEKLGSKKETEEVEVPEKYKGVFKAFKLPEDFDYKKELAKRLAEDYERLG